MTYPTVTELPDGTLLAVWTQYQITSGEKYGDIHAGVGLAASWEGSSVSAWIFAIQSKLKNKSDRLGSTRCLLPFDGPRILPALWSSDQRVDPMAWPQASTIPIVLPAVFASRPARPRRSSDVRHELPCPHGFSMDWGAAPSGKAGVVPTPAGGNVPSSSWRQ